jgi:hypothetical protein
MIIIQAMDEEDIKVENEYNNLQDRAKKYNPWLDEDSSIMIYIGNIAKRSISQVNGGLDQNSFPKLLILLHHKGGNKVLVLI